jgi:hypothetical protein
LPLAHVEQGEHVAVGVASTPSFGAPSAVPVTAARVERGGAEHVGNVRCRGDAELGAERVHLAPSRDQAWESQGTQLEARISAKRPSASWRQPPGTVRR